MGPFYAAQRYFLKIASHSRIFDPYSAFAL